MKPIIYIFFGLLILLSCTRTKEKAKKIINESGEVVGKSLSEFGEGVATGVDETFTVTIFPSAVLVGKGLEVGTVTLGSADGGEDNLLSVYLIFNKDFDDTITLKAFSSDNLEMGRCRLPVFGKAGDADYFDFTFHKQTNIDSDSRVVME